MLTASKKREHIGVAHANRTLCIFCMREQFGLFGKIHTFILLYTKSCLLTVSPLNSEQARRGGEGKRKKVKRRKALHFFSSERKIITQLRWTVNCVVFDYYTHDSVITGNFEMT